MKNIISQIFDLGDFVPEILKIYIERFSKIMTLLKIPMFSLIQLDLLDKNSIKYGRKKEGKCLHLHFWSCEIFVNIFERFSEKSKSKNKDMFRGILKTASTRLWSPNYILKTLSNTPLANLLGIFQKLSKYQHLLFSWSNKTWQANYDF